MTTATFGPWTIEPASGSGWRAVNGSTRECYYAASRSECFGHVQDAMPLTNVLSHGCVPFPPQDA